MKRNWKQWLIGGVVVAMVIVGLIVVGEKKSMAVDTSSTLQSGDELVVGWGEKRQLPFKALEEDLATNGVPGGGSLEDVTMVVFYKSDGKAFVADMTGNEVHPCAALVNGKTVPIEITDGTVLVSDDESRLCSNLKGTNILGVRPNVTIITHKSPDCPIISIGGYLIQVCP